MGCQDRAARRADDIYLCKAFIVEAHNSMVTLGKDTFEPGDLDFHQLRLLTPSDPDWRDAQYLVLRAAWSAEDDEKRIVIVCGQSRVRDNKAVHCVAYNTGETEWVPSAAIAELQLSDYIVLPHIRY